MLDLISFVSTPNTSLTTKNSSLIELSNSIFLIIYCSYNFPL